MKVMEVISSQLILTNNTPTTVFSSDIKELHFFFVRAILLQTATPFFVEVNKHIYSFVSSRIIYSFLSLWKILNVFKNHHLIRKILYGINRTLNVTKNNVTKIKIFYLNLKTILRNFSTILVTLWSCERLCMVLKRLNTYLVIWLRNALTLHKKWIFPLMIFSINVTKSAVFCGFGHI